MILHRRGAIASAAQRAPRSALSAAEVAEVEFLLARQARRLALNHVLAPTALGLLGEYEGWNAMASGGVERALVVAVGDLDERAGGDLEAGTAEFEHAALGADGDLGAFAGAHRAGIGRWYDAGP